MENIINSGNYYISIRGIRGVFPWVFFIVYQASTGKKLCEERHGKFHKIQNFDAKHSDI